jgi:hypothetical protein
VRIPAFARDAAWVRDTPISPPRAPTPPYITYELIKPAFGQAGIANVHVWNFLTAQGGTDLIDDILDQIAERIPEEGLALANGPDRCNGGFILYRDNLFVQYLGDDVDHTITRGIASYIVKGYSA